MVNLSSEHWTRSSLHSTLLKLKKCCSQALGPWPALLSLLERTNERTEQVVTRHRSRHQLYRKLLVRLDWYVNSHTVSLPILNIVLRLPGSQVLIFVILTKSSQCLLTLLLCSAAFPMVFSLTVFTCMCTWPSRNPRNNCPKMGRSQWKSHEG